MTKSEPKTGTRHCAAALTLLLGLGWMNGAAAQTTPAPTAPAPTTPTNDPRLPALTRLFAATTVQAEWFAPDFLAQVPLETIQAQWTALQTQFGAFVRLEAGPPVVAVYERGQLQVTAATVDAQGRLTSFGITPVAPDLTPAQQQLGIDALTELLSVAPLKTDLLSPEFLADVPDIAEQFASQREQFGTFQNVTADADGWTLNFSGGTVSISELQLNEQGQIDTLVSSGSRRKFASLDEARAALEKLPGQVSLLVQSPGQPARAELNAGRLMGVGSAFKLAILAELQAQVAAGQHHWTDEVTLTDAAKSLPSGTLQDAATGSRYTLRDLSERMIRDSDNTATDLLLGVVGRERVEARLGQRPMPNTREAFALKNPANLELLRAYRNAGLNVVSRREVLAQAANAPLPTDETFTDAPLARDVEWFVSTERLCRLMNEVATLPEAQRNPGLADPDAFQSVSFKGGSEPGVLNLTTQVTTKAGQTTCVSATWNAPTKLDDQQFAAIYTGILDLLK